MTCIFFLIVVLTMTIFLEIERDISSLTKPLFLACWSGRGVPLSAVLLWHCTSIQTNNLKADEWEETATSERTVDAEVCYHGAMRLARLNQAQIKDKP